MSIGASLAGAAIILSASVYWGYDRSKKEKEALLFICGLIALCDFSQMHIKLFRTPKGEIFQKFSDEYLERIGFLTYIREGETQRALALVRGVLDEKGCKAVDDFITMIGSGYEEDQRALCQYTSEQLRDIEGEKQKDLERKLKMYRLLPVLIACSVIILLI